MPTYEVAVHMVVSAVVEVEADTPELARDLAYESPQMPGSITGQAFGSGASVSEAGDWEAVSVELDGEQVWPVLDMRKQG